VVLVPLVILVDIYNIFTLKFKYSGACCASSFRLFEISQCLHCQGQAVKEYPGADKSLARPGRKQARKDVRDARDFNNIETRAVMFFFIPLQDKASKEIHAFLTETLVCFLPGRAKDLSAPLYLDCMSVISHISYCGLIKEPTS
jgi:hypothetical protein